ncbi:Serpin B11 [Thelohanellus kitauei]|uniref:Serpin B11 n=1 Tax=Thelohanellus kitauei TaxID=669202 RepID=A0A0C2MK34_THEKT|nr:Serpin B11 [Thelohanellus kitauei]
MSAEAVNRFTFDVFNQLYLSQNSTGNIAFSGTILYLMMGAISIGLRGRSYEKLSKFLHRDVDQFIDNEDWVKSGTAKWWSKLRSKSVIERSSKILIIYPGQLSAHYKRISRQIFQLVYTKIDLPNAEEFANEINVWIDRHVISDHILKVVKKSMVSENKILFISAVHFQIEWKTQFFKCLNDPWFYGDNNEVSKAEVICLELFVRTYKSPNSDFEIIFQTMDQTDFILVIVMKSYAYSTDEMLNSFKVEQLPTYHEQSEQDFVRMVLPKFNLPASYDFVPELTKLGLTDIFFRNDTEFGRMTNHSVIMENLLQVTSVSVDEFGINTHKTYDELLVQSNVKELRVDRPFLFLIYSSNDNLVHFSALVKKPTVN